MFLRLEGQELRPGVLVNEYTGTKFSVFYSRKNDIVEPMCERLQHATGRGAQVKYLRQDNAGENLKIQARCKSADWKLPVEIEYTAKDTPQQNSMSETSFSSMAAQARAMMTAANVPMIERYRLFQEAANHLTKLGWLTVIIIGRERKTRIKHCGMPLPSWSNNLKTSGKAGRVKTKNRKRKKIKRFRGDDDMCGVCQQTWARCVQNA